MDAYSEYYIRKYNHLQEQIKRLKHENSLLEELTSGTLGSSQRDTTTGSSSTSSPPTNPPSPPTNPPSPPPPTGPDYNGDGVVDGADLGIFNAYYGQPGFDGAALGALLSAIGQSSSGGGGQEPPPPPPPPPPPQSPSQPSFGKKTGTSTKDIASLSTQRYDSYT